MIRGTIAAVLIGIHFITFSQSVDQRINELIGEMSTIEKMYQLTSDTYFSTGDNTRLNIPGFMMSDGPHGVRFGGASVFPVGIAQAATWDVALIERMGEAMGNEFWQKGKHQQLGPCLDLCRDPRNGRSPETLGEDPYLAAEIGVAIVQGIQKTPVVATAKHLNLVNKQQYRYNSNAIISDRWLIEHYGHDFRKVVQSAGVKSVMNAYNLINGVHCSQNAYLMQSILRDKWGFPFYVVSDWGAVHNTEQAIESGTDICMGSSHYQDDLPGLISSGAVSMETLDKAVYKVLKTKLMNGMLDDYPRCLETYINSPEHNDLVLEAGKKSLVLLKNEDQILPLDTNAIVKVAVIGPSANKAQLDGFGSSWVDPVYTVSPRQGFENILGSSRVAYAMGCDINSSDTSGFAQARQLAAGSDYVIFVGGLDDTQEGEGYGDRPEYDRAGGSVDLPGQQLLLINELAAVNENMIVVLKSGGICGVNDAIDNIKGFIYAFYPGHEGGNAIAQAVLGRYNPGGKLPVSMPKNDGQLPPWNDNFNDDYGCGYRWYDEMQIDPEFAFGHGLSYTNFTYNTISLSSNTIASGQSVYVTVSLTNSGLRDGDEVVQLYLSDQESSMWMPQKQLKGFSRIHLLAGETKEVTFELEAEDFYYWNESVNEYRIEPGQFSVRVGGASDNLPLQTSFEITEADLKPDLRIANIYTQSRYPLEGDTVGFMVNILNTGTTSISPGDNFDIEFSIDDQLVTTQSYNDIYIPVGGLVMLEASNQPWIPLEGGEYELTANVDSNNEIDETIEDKNMFSVMVQVHDSSDFQFMDNICLHKPVYASSVESEDYKAEFAVDGNNGTRWSSEFTDPQKFVVYLRGLYDLQKIRINWENAYSDEYTISVSADSVDWTEIIYESNGTGGIVLYELDAEARYIRFEGLSRATEWGHSFYEFEAYGYLIEGDLGTGDTDPFRHDIAAFPNPAINKLNLTGLSPFTNIKSRILNANGMEMNAPALQNNSIDVSGLNQGMYFVILICDDQQFIVPFVKM